MRQFLFAVLVVVLIIWVAVGAIQQFGLSREGDACPSCGSIGDSVPIVYGKPGKDLIEKASRGQVVLGGCMISSDSPRWHCRQCGTDWGRYRSGWCPND